MDTGKEFSDVQDALKVAKKTIKRLESVLNERQNPDLTWSVENEDAKDAAYDNLKAENDKYQVLWNKREEMIRSMNIPVSVLSQEKRIRAMAHATRTQYFDIDGNRCGPYDPRRRGYKNDDDE